MSEAKKEVNLEDYREYRNPLGNRYASVAMRRLFSEDYKFRTWRKLWAALAQAEHELGLAEVTADRVEQIKSLQEKPIDYAYAEAKEAQLRHDVMSHIHEVSKQIPDAGKIVHLGATSCFVTDNTELIQMKEALVIIRGKLHKLIKALAAFAEKYKDLPTLGFTHYQPAQLTT
jgi:adenylosuccinate lyase